MVFTWGLSNNYHTKTCNDLSSIPLPRIATSALDSESERLVQAAMDDLLEQQGCTSIIIAHRLATIREVDCIYVLDEGKIIEEGTHEELSEKEGGLYSSLARLQFELS